MPQSGLDEAQVDAGLEPMRCLAVAQGLDRGTLRDATMLEGGSAGILPTVAGHGAIGRSPADPAAAWSRQEPDGMTVRVPVRAQEVQGALGQGHRAVLGAFAAAHVHEHAGTVNVGNLQVGALLQA